MPMLEIEIVGDLDAAVSDGLAARLADVAGDVLGSPRGGTWVRLRTLAASHYAENGGGPPEGVQPVFVSVLKQVADLLGGVDAQEIRHLTEAIAHVCNRPPDHVHVRYEPEGRGRQAFGGTVVT